MRALARRAGQDVEHRQGEAGGLAGAGLRACPARRGPSARWGSPVPGSASGGRSRLRRRRAGSLGQAEIGEGACARRLGASSSSSVVVLGTSSSSSSRRRPAVRRPPRPVGAAAFIASVGSRPVLPAASGGTRRLAVQRRAAGSAACGAVASGRVVQSRSFHGPARRAARGGLRWVAEPRQGAHPGPAVPARQSTSAGAYAPLRREDQGFPPLPAAWTAAAARRSSRRHVRRARPAAAARPALRRAAVARPGRGAGAARAAASWPTSRWTTRVARHGGARPGGAGGPASPSAACRWAAMSRWRSCARRRAAGDAARAVRHLRPPRHAGADAPAPRADRAVAHRAVPRRDAAAAAAADPPRAPRRRRSRPR